ncbi:MAG: sulfurtransferase [Dehalococcoidia bacterium]
MNDALVSTQWVADRLAESGVRVVEVSFDEGAYVSGHLPGAANIDWRRELIENEDESSGMVIAPQRFADLARRLGLRPDDTLVFYGDQGGRHATRAFWMFEYYRHPGALHVMDGGREQWQREGRPVTADVPALTPSDYPVPGRADESLRVTKDEIVSGLGRQGFVTLDVRTRGEYEGTDVRAARGGHIPGATHIFWEEALTPDTTLRPKGELDALYASLPKDSEIAVHCQLGVRAAHTWFVLRHVLGYPNAKNYDGSWQEWGNEPGTPIEG